VQHVFADTLRSFAVIIAAVSAKVVDGVTPEEADATAAVVVSVLILVSLIPLFHGLRQTSLELRAIWAEESSESLFSEESKETNELLIV
jgi:Co/Zn/Cd efflux system component